LKAENPLQKVTNYKFLNNQTFCNIENNKEKSGNDSDNDSDILKREIHFDDENSQNSDKNKWDRGKLMQYR
jgi:hypothetical protein